MSWWNPTEEEEAEDRRRMAENKQKLKQSWSRIREDIERDGEAKRRLSNMVKELVNDPQSVSDLTDEELDYYKISAEIEIERLDNGIRTLKSISRQGNKSGFGALFDLMGSTSESLVQHKAADYKKLKALIVNEQARRRKKAEPPKLSPAQQKAQESAAILEEIEEMERIRDERIKKNPAQKDVINRHFRRMIDELKEQL